MELEPKTVNKIILTCDQEVSNFENSFADNKHNPFGSLFLPESKIDDWIHMVIGKYRSPSLFENADIPIKVLEFCENHPDDVIVIYQHDLSGETDMNKYYFENKDPALISDEYDVYKYYFKDKDLALIFKLQVAEWN